MKAPDHHARPADARRGALILLGGDAAAADGFAADGYETVTIAPEDLAAWAGQLAPPVFLLSDEDAAIAAWIAACAGAPFAAVSIVADERIGAVIDEPPRAATILHLTPAAHLALAERIEAAHPDLPAHMFDGGADARRLVRLRTLQLFALNGGGRGEL